MANEWAFNSSVSNATGINAKTANTFDRSVDQKLWAALMAKSPILDMLARPQVDNYKFEWETDTVPTTKYTAHGDTAATTIDNHATNAVIEFNDDPVTLQAGSIIRNVTRPTPIGSYGQDEQLLVLSVDHATKRATVQRDAGGQNGGNGSLLQCYNGTTQEDSVYEVIYTAVPEGSGPGVNRYADVTLVENYANSVDFYLVVTGDQAATKRLVAGDTIENQWSKNLTMLNNQLEGMFFYGTLPSANKQGTADVLRRTQGLDSWVGAAGGNVDVTTQDVTPDAIDDLLYEIVADNSDPADRYIIAANPFNTRKISKFGIDKVRLGQSETKYGRYIDTFKSDLGMDVPVIWSLNITKSDLFIIDMDKVSMPCFRAFQKAAWSYGDDGIDAYRQRYLGSFGVKVVDGLYSHAKLGLLPWS